MLHQPPDGDSAHQTVRDFLTGDQTEQNCILEFYFKVRIKLDPLVKKSNQREKTFWARNLQIVDQSVLHGDDCNKLCKFKYYRLC